MVVRMLVSLAALAFVIAALIFIPAGTLDYWQAWLFLACYFSASLIVSLWLASHAYLGIVHDGRLYTIQAMRSAGHAALSQDLFLKFGSLVLNRASIVSVFPFVSARLYAAGASSGLMLTPRTHSGTLTGVVLLRRMFSASEVAEAPSWFSLIASRKTLIRG